MGLTYQNWMQIDAIHIQPFNFVQIVEFSSCWRHPSKLLMIFGHSALQISRLISNQTEFGYISI